MAMIRGRKIRVEKKERDFEIDRSSPNGKNCSAPLARLKQQRRLTIGYSKTPEKLLEPIEDPDPFYKDKKTFLVLNENRLIFRFSEEKSLYLFGRESRFRRHFINILVNKWFNGIVIVTILINCLVMMITGNDKPQWSEKYVEHIFTAIYTIEAAVKIVGRGFVLHRFSYLRDPWNWLDFIVIIAAYVLVIISQTSAGDASKISSLTFLRAIRVLRVFKTVSVIPGLRMIVSALVASTKALKDAMLLSLLGFSMFSLVGFQFFRGTLHHKCVLRPPALLPYPPMCYETYGMNQNNSTTSLCKMNEVYGKVILSNFGSQVMEEMTYLDDVFRASQNQTTYMFSSGTFEQLTNSSIATAVLPTESSLSFTTVNTEIWDSSNSTIEKGQCPVVQGLLPWKFQKSKIPKFNSTNYKFDWKTWTTNPQKYLKNGVAYQLCGNLTGTLQCPAYTMCLKVGSNPNFGFTSFDNFPFAFLSVFRLSLQDNWEELYLQVLETSGPVSVLFFLTMIFLGSYYLVNLILAVVASSYEGQRKSVENALEVEKVELLNEKEILTKRRNAARTVVAFKADDLQIQKKRFYHLRSWYKCGDIMIKWSCCEGSSIICRIRSKLHKFFTASAAEMITVTLVVLNTLFMAMEKEPKDDIFKNLLYYSNVVFTALFAIEMALKIFALSPYNYFKAAWNIFDFVVVTLSVFELIVSDKLPDGLSVLRTFRLIRLVRILKLAKSWPTLSKLMQMIADSLSKVGYLTLVLLIVLVIFALAGMQTIGTQFFMDRTTGLPLRWHMNSFPHAFLVVFRIQCGEWIQSMWSCMNSVRTEGSDGLIPVCLFIFIGVVFVGNLVVLNLFLALLLNSFNSDALNAGGTNRSGARKFLKSLRNAGMKALPKLPAPIKRKRKVCPSSSRSTTDSENSLEKTTPPAIHVRDAQNENGHNSNNISNYSRELTNGIRMNGKTLANATPDTPSKRTESMDTVEHNSDDWKPDIALPMTFLRNNNEYHHEVAANEHSNGHKHTPPMPTKSCNGDLPAKEHWTITVSRKCGLSWVKLKEKWCKFRMTMNMVVQHNIFESFIIFVILLSSVALVFDDVTLPSKPKFKFILGVFDRIFTAIFVVEMLMKWVGFGLKKYFTNGWCLLDFFIVVVSLVSLSLEIIAMQQQGKSNTDLSSLRVLRSLRAFRPLRAMSRFEGIKVVTDALFRSIPSILNVFVICLIFWLIFAIMGVNLFAGKMASCKWKATGEKVWHKTDYKNYPELAERYPPPPIDVVDIDSCLCLANITGGKVHWTNLPINFDNVFIAYIALLQVATFKGWMPIMYAAVDAPTKVGLQPVRDANIYNYFFFVAFIIFGAFFTLNLFISVVIDNFNQQKKKFEFAGTELFLTDTQKRVYNAMKKLKAKLPKTLFPVPKAPWRERLYLFTTGDKFELGVMVITILNLLAMALEYEGMSPDYQSVIKNINYGFVVVFTLEIVIRIIAMGKSYFYVPWNVFDFLLILASVLANAIPIIITHTNPNTVSTVTSTPWLPMFRMVRVARILRVARVASGIRTLLFALMLSAPALFNVGSLLFLFVFIYAIFGMNQFALVEKKGAINDILNFETFPNTFLLLFQMSTSAGWDGFMEPTLYVEGNPACVDSKNGEKGTCMSTSFVGYFYFVSYLLVTFVIITNMYIAIILENFDLATKDNEEAVTADDFEHFFDMWQRYDKNGNGKLTVTELSELLHNIDRPLRIRKPNKHHIANMRIPMDSEGEIYLLDVASALTKKIIGTDGFTDETESELRSYYKRKCRGSLRSESRTKVTNTYDYVMNIDDSPNNVIDRVIASPLTIEVSRNDGYVTNDIVTKADIHPTREMQVVLPAFHEQAKSAQIVTSPTSDVTSYTLAATERPVNGLKIEDELKASRNRNSNCSRNPRTLNGEVGNATVNTLKTLCAISLRIQLTENNASHHTVHDNSRHNSRFDRHEIFSPWLSMSRRVRSREGNSHGWLNSSPRSNKLPVPHRDDPESNHC
uniref:sodium channel protein type 4 subunit alpha B-like isoform X2 n=1 Tax=Ciona intestinalis TaxID=7719 RepID=UPI00089DD5ED|nr:sodium channel protein type 4 subunit alpha B-like isoform X2 [Ciona intestinalis]|eukprot:XP_018669384.1 sodium channel protein type 4 subunit alpha B-like isoform X2 [Ciona intestinalis]